MVQNVFAPAILRGMKTEMTDAEFVAAFQKLGPMTMCKRYGLAERTVHTRRRRIEAAMNIELISPVGRGGALGSHVIANADDAVRYQMTLVDGEVIVGSDAHYWPGPATTAHRAFCLFIKKRKIKRVIVNGDVIDASTISRHPPIGWEQMPTLVDELEAAQERMHEIEQAAGKGAEKLWPLGNHDARFETRLATVAPEFKGIDGIHLKDHFPLWTPCWSTEINNSVIVKHRWKGGMHAAHNNAVSSGRSMVTGHTHSLKVTPYDDYNGTRWGVESGTLSDPKGPQYTYSEDSPRNHRAGFVLLTFKDSKLLWPETIDVVAPGKVQFRGEIIEV